MATRLTLLCHAPVARDLGVRFLADEPADAAGLAHLPDLGRFARLLTAPELRARQTAAALAPEPLVVPDLRDCDYGRWRGRDLGEIADAEGAATALWLADPAAAPHGGESHLALIARVGRWLDAGPCEGHTVAVTHPAVIRAALVHALGAPAAAFWRVDVEPSGRADLRWNAGRWSLRALGRL
jgi:broad specificity phosphatase PhoE